MSPPSTAVMMSDSTRRVAVWDHLNIPGTAKARNLKFGVQIDYYEYYAKHAKLGDKRGVAKVT